MKINDKAVASEKANITAADASANGVIKLSLGKKKHALLVGYSQGADVLPFAVNRLPPATRALVKQTTLIGVEAAGPDWVGSGDGYDLAITPPYEVPCQLIGFDLVYEPGGLL